MVPRRFSTLKVALAATPATPKTTRPRLPRRKRDGDIRKLVSFAVMGADNTGGGGSGAPTLGGSAPDAGGSCDGAWPLVVNAATSPAVVPSAV